MPHSRWKNSRGGPSGVDVLRAPAAEGDERGPELERLLGQEVVVAGGALLVGLASQQAGVDELGEPAGQHAARHLQPLLEVVEAADAEERVAQDQQRPALADDLEVRAMEQVCSL